MHLPSIPSDDITNIIKDNIKKNQNFARYVNMSARPILQNAKINAPNAHAPAIHIYGIPYATDSKRQLLNPVYLIFNGLDSSKYALYFADNELRSEVDSLIRIILHKNPALNNYLFSKENFVAYINRSDHGTNISLIGEQYAVLKDDFENYITKYIDPISAEYDQLGYPLIFWDGKGGSGRLTLDENWTIKELRYCGISLLMQPNDHFIYQIATLRKEHLCSIYGRIMQIRINLKFQRQMLLLKENEIKKVSLEMKIIHLINAFKTFILSSLTVGPFHWKKLSNEPFLLSVSLGPPTLFITITENLYWPEIISIDNQSYLTNLSLLMRVFCQKRMCFIQYLKKSKMFGEVKGYVWGDEYQQRGLPHCHILLWTDFDTSILMQLIRL